MFTEEPEDMGPYRSGHRESIPIVLVRDTRYKFLLFVASVSVLVSATIFSWPLFYDGGEGGFACGAVLFVAGVLLGFVGVWIRKGGAYIAVYRSRLEFCRELRKGHSVVSVEAMDRFCFKSASNSEAASELMLKVTLVDGGAVVFSGLTFTDVGLKRVGDALEECGVPKDPSEVRPVPEGIRPR